MMEPPDSPAAPDPGDASTAAPCGRDRSAPHRNPRGRGWLDCVLRLWLFRPVGRPAGRPGRAAAVMAAAWLIAWIAIDRWLAQPDPQFSAFGIPLLGWYGLVIIAAAALLRWRSEPIPAYAETLALVLGIVPLPLLFTSLAVPHLHGATLPAAAALVGLYMLAYFARGLRALTGAPQRVAACAAIVLVLAAAWLGDRFDFIPDLWLPADSASEQSDGASVDGEAVLFEQSARIEDALAAVHRGPSAAPQGFFLGFAGVGDQKVFAQEIGLAGRVLGERFGLGARKLALLNDQRDLEAAPLATVSGLRYALRGLAARMDLDRDVLFLSISSHGGEDATVEVSNSDLPLDPLADEDLAEALSDAGIKWRVIVISACYAGGFIPALRDPKTIVIAAAAADRTSFGCSNDRDLTYFGEAFYRDALPGAASLRAAFEAAKAAVAKREHDERVTPSNPQAYFGTELEAKLEAMTDGSRAGR
ncbi:MAG TPA: C13 family peptidase [Steroidobacteraceae bacterium]|jgi:hypothetical protein|nr:C13 family peptidase [Steroidobacteraceae bacterium]